MWWPKQSSAPDKRDSFGRARRSVSVPALVPLPMLHSRATEASSLSTTTSSLQSWSRKKKGYLAENNFGGSSPNRSPTRKLPYRKQRRASQAVVEEPLVVDLEWCKFPVVTDCVLELGWRRCGVPGAPVIPDDGWNIMWVDNEISLPVVKLLGPGQKINHFPGIMELTSKCHMAYHLNGMRVRLPEAYSFVPLTFVLPEEEGEFVHACEQGGRPRTFIVKPDMGSLGKGIFLTRKPKSVPRDQALVVQQYIDRPLLIDGMKFDFRLYVLVTSFTPLVAYLYREGLSRFSTVAYSEPELNNCSNMCMHLTNYCINRDSANFVESKGIGDAFEEGCSKRTIRHVLGWLDANGFNSKRVWFDIRDVVWKTLIAIEPALAHHYRVGLPEGDDPNQGFSCFQLLGFDVLLDEDAKPWLIEVNGRPSLRTSSPLDAVIKRGVVSGALRIVSGRHVGTSGALCQKQEEHSFEPLGPEIFEEDGGDSLRQAVLCRTTAQALFYFGPESLAPLKPPPCLHPQPGLPQQLPHSLHQQQSQPLQQPLLQQLA
mmetsp:Transcript_26231/g.51366  ORF Transcript_26231/g.51366 Transcript_26231/m.51366 type:complete len:541 (+) Transcript_26231:173-1795(+)